MTGIPDSLPGLMHQFLLEPKRTCDFGNQHATAESDIVMKMNPGDRSIQLIRDSFPLSQLLDAEQLDPYASPHELKPNENVLENSHLVTGRLTFLDADLRPIVLVKPSLDLCRDASSAMGLFDVCAACPARQRPPVDDKTVFHKCGTGCVLRCVAAIRVKPQMQPIGYVRGPDVPTDEFYQLDFSHLKEGLGEDLVRHRQALQAMDAETIGRVVSRIARRLSRRCELERRLKILRHTRKRIVGSTTQQEVLDAGFLGLQALFGAVDVCLYVLTQTGTLQFVDARGPNQLSQPDTLEAHQGHIGRVIWSQKPYYAADLTTDPQGFVQPDSDFPIRSAYTVPLIWGPDEKAAALQVSSTSQDRFMKADRQSIWALADTVSLAGVRIALRPAQRAFGFAELQPGSWADCLIQTIAAPTGTLVQILEAKQLLMQGLADEALLCTESANSVVQVFDTADQSLRFAACSGPDWTEEAKAKAKEYKLGALSPAMCALQHGEHFVANTGLQGNFQPILQATKSVYALRFRSREPIIGVISVCWPHPLLSGSDPSHKEKLFRLVRQFESVFGALDSRERDIQRKLVATLASRPTLNSEKLSAFARETVNQTRAAFGVRGCSIFLVFPGQEFARLVATTGILPEKPIWYAPGEGLTGWVLKTGRCLRLKNTTDQNELHAIDPNLKGVKKWVEDVEYRDAEGKRRFLAAPMICQSKVVGVIRLSIKEMLQDFTPEEETLLAQIAREMAETVVAGWKQVSAEEDLAETAKEIQQLHRIGLGFAQAPDVRTMIQQVLANAITESKMKWGIVRLLNVSTKQLELRESQGPPPAALPLDLSLNPVMERALSSDAPVYIPDTRDDGLWAELIAALPEGPRRSYLESVRTVIHVPIRLKARTLGLVLLESPNAIDVPKRVLDFLDMLGGYAAVALELAEARNRLQEELDFAKPLSKVGIFTAACLHEIGNRTNDLKSIVQNMNAMMDSPEQMTDQIGLLKREVGSLEEICERLQLFTPGDRAEDQMERIRLDHVVTSAISDYGRKPPGGVEIRKKPGEPVTLLGHPAMLRSAFVNIIKNAVEAMPQGGLVTVEVETVDGAPAVSFTDIGPGMDPVTRRRVLEPFFSTKGSRGRRGLGLAAVHGIMMLHGGRVRVESEFGKGSKFTLIFLPEDARK